MANSGLKILWLRERFPWMGTHSGYEQICDVLAALFSYQHQNIWKDSRLTINNRIIRRLLSPVADRVKTGENYDAFSVFAELKVLLSAFGLTKTLVHVVYIERALGLLPFWKKRLSLGLVATAHQPAGLWRCMRHNPSIVTTLDRLIVLSSKDVAYFEQFIPGRVHFIPHGVDLDFFQPQSGNPSHSDGQDYPRCVFSGTWLRDIQTLSHVIDKILTHEPNIKFDMVVPLSKRNNPYLYRIARHEQVAWHANISDEQLRSLYCQASVLVLPLTDCTANNALLESVACGLPVVTSNVGGIPDYTLDTFADLLPVGDVDGYVEAILKLVSNPQELIKRGFAARQFAEENLAWDKVASQTIDIYKKVMKSADNN